MKTQCSYLGKCGHIFETDLLEMEEDEWAVYNNILTELWKQLDCASVELHSCYLVVDIKIGVTYKLGNWE